jgi:beta-N-acetylhexosaminidase
MPTIARSWDAMWQQDIAPYRALSKQLPMVMVAHAAYPNASKSGLPASISPYWVTQILREKMNYSGLIVSDDMEMGGILTQRSMEDAAVEAIAAGVDLLEICKDPSLVVRTYEALLSEGERSSAFRRRIATSERRIAQGQKKLLSRLPRVPTVAAVEKMRAKIHRFSGQIS